LESELETNSGSSVTRGWTELKRHGKEGRNAAVGLGSADFDPAESRVSRFGEIRGHGADSVVNGSGGVLTA